MVNTQAVLLWIGALEAAGPCFGVPIAGGNLSVQENKKEARERQKADHGQSVFRLSQVLTFPWSKRLQEITL